MVNEKRLVDLYEFLKECDKLLKNPPFVHPATPWDRGLMIAVETALSLPTVDAVEVVHGLWKYYHKNNIAVCTNCSFERNLDDDFGRAVSCPNCGADMRGSEE